MDTNTGFLIKAYMKALYDGKPEGNLKESVQDFEARLVAFAENNPGSADLLNESGLADEYSRLYMAVISGNNDHTTEGGKTSKIFDYQKEQRIPSVKEYLDTYRNIYENTVKPNGKVLTDKAYQKLFEVEERTDDLIEAQIIIEKEHLILDTVIAEYKDAMGDFLEAADPNYDVTTAVADATIGAYSRAKSIDEITYTAEKAHAVCSDLSVQIIIRTAMMTAFVHLMYSWHELKRRIRLGGPQMPGYVRSMVLARSQIRKLCRFMKEDMGIGFQDIVSTPFYMISSLNPQGLDELWRIKKVMHPANLKAMQYALYEEILTDRPLEEILLTPQKEPYYGIMNTLRYPDLDKEFRAVADELNKDIKFFRRNRRPGSTDASDVKELMDRTGRFSMDITGGIDTGGMSPKGGMTGAAGNIKKVFSGMQTGAGSDAMKDMKKEAVKSAAGTAAREIGKGFLRSLFRR